MAHLVAQSPVSQIIAFIRNILELLRPREQKRALGGLACGVHCAAAEVRMTTYRSRISSFAFLAGLTAVGCSSDKDPQKNPSVANISSELMNVAATCEDVSSNLKAQFRAELAKVYTIGSCGTYPTYLPNGGPIDDGQVNSGVGWGASGVGGSMSAPTTSASNGVATAVGTSTATSNDVTGDKANVVTQTNVQVKDVDEGDIIKTDGKNLYVLHDRALELVAASTTGKLTSSAGVALEGLPREMYVVGGADAATRKVVVISDVNGQEVYAKAGAVIPSNTPGYSNMGMVGSGGMAGFVTTVGTAGGTVIGGTGVGGAVTVAPAVEGPAAGVTTTSPNGFLPMTKVTVFEGTDSSLNVKSQAYYDGYYQSSRRQDEQLHIVFGINKSWPQVLSCPTESERLKAELVVLEEVMNSGRSVADVPAEELGVRVGDALVDATFESDPTLLSGLVAENFLPRSFVVDGSELVEQKFSCGGIYLPKAGSSVTGVTYVESIDLTEPTKGGGGHAILGASQIMYENREALILATNASEWKEPQLVWGETAYVHRFNLGPSGLVYETSGKIDGRIKDQFSLDVSGGDLRVVVSEGWRTTQVNHLDILRRDETTHLLKTVGSVGEIGDGEDVKAVRFLGDTAYVVTFVQTDPLYAIDVSEAAAPKILGELADIPGFSTYIHPMDENHLLTIGQDPSKGTPMIQIFDVTDRGHPQQLHTLSLAANGNTAAMSDYKAFTYYPEQSLLAIPYNHYNVRPFNAMQLFNVSVSEGISAAGQVNGDFILGVPETDVNSCYYWGYSGETFARSIFFDDILFAIAQRGIASVKIDTPDKPIDRLVFNDVTKSANYYCDTYYTTGGATSVGGTSVGGSVGVLTTGSSPATATGTSTTSGAGGTAAVID